MKDLRLYLVKPLQPKRLTNSTAALAGLASAISVFVGVLAARAAPHGWLRLASALHLHRQPLIVKLAPLVAGVAITIATAAGLFKFYSWCIERDAEETATESDSERIELIPLDDQTSR
jgi:hypothetical protein